MHASPPYPPYGQPSPVWPYGYHRSSDSGMEGQTPGYCRQQATFLGTGCASSNVFYPRWPEIAPSLQGKPSRPTPSPAEQLLCLQQLMYAQQQQQLILQQQRNLQHSSQRNLQQQNLPLPTLNRNAMTQPPSCYPVQATQAPAIQHQQPIQTSPMCQLPRQSCPQQVAAPHHPQASHGLACFPQPGHELYMRTCMPQLSNGQHQTYQPNGLWPGQSNAQVSSAPGGAQSPAAHHPVASQAWPNAHLRQTSPTNAYQNPESSPRCDTEPSYSQEPQITIQVTPGIPGNSEATTADTPATSDTEGLLATGSCDSEDKKISRERCRSRVSRVSFSASSPESPESEAEDPPLAKQSVEQGPTETSTLEKGPIDTSTTDCISSRCTGKNVPSHSLDDLFEEEDGIANDLQEPKPVVKRAPSRKGSRPQILTLRKSAAYFGNCDGRIGHRGRQGSIPRAPLDPLLFATEEEDQEARARLQRAADHESKQKTQAAGNPCCAASTAGLHGLGNRKIPRKTWSSVDKWGGRETLDLERVIEDCLAKGYTRQQVLEQKSSLFTTEEIEPRMPLPKGHSEVFRSRASM